MTELEKMVTVIEKEYIQQLIDLLHQDKINTPEAKISAQEFLALGPFVSLQDLEQKLKGFGEKYPLFNPLYMTMYAYVEKAQTDSKVQKMHELIKQDKIDEALQLVYTG
jgi:hypothetical protein